MGHLYFLYFFFLTPLFFPSQLQFHLTLHTVSTLNRRSSHHRFRSQMQLSYKLFGFLKLADNPSMIPSVFIQFASEICPAGNFLDNASTADSSLVWSCNKIEYLFSLMQLILGLINRAITQWYLSYTFPSKLIMRGASLDLR